MSLKPCCATGSLHTGTPTGRGAKVHGLDCYIADASSGSPKGIIVIIPDAFGWTLPNNRILADCYARENFTVYLPDFMDGTSKTTSETASPTKADQCNTGNILPPEILTSLKAMSATGFWNQLYKISHAAYMFWHFVPWLISCRAGVTGPRIYSWLKALKKNEAKNLPAGTAGFCWGGQFVTKLCWDQDENKTDDGQRVTDCGFVAHPSFLTFPSDIEMITLPYSCAASEHDQQMSPEQAEQTEKTLKSKTAKTKDQGVEHEFVMYHGAHHGFAVRADEEDKHEAECGKKAEKQALEWFGRWFAKPPPSV